MKDLLFKTAMRWSADSVPRLSAAFSFYAILSLSPLLVLAVTVAGSFMAGAEKRLLSEASGFVGPQGAEFLHGLIQNTHNRSASIIATASSLVVTFFSASNLFLQLDESMKAIWNVKQGGTFIRTLIKTRVLAFFGVLLFGGVVVGWLVLDSWLRWLARYSDAGSMWPVISTVLSTLLLVLAFAVSFKSLPANKLKWGDVWPAAVLTAVGFALSKFLLNEYFGYARLSAAYGAAGALVVILLWIYYTSQIYFFGAEFAYMWAHEYGSAYRAPSLHTEDLPLAPVSTNSEA